MSSTNRPTYLAAVRELLMKHFNEEELKTLCFSLGLDYDNLPAAGKNNKARELVLYLERYSRITELKTIISKQRPDILWPDTAASTTIKEFFDFPPADLASNNERGYINMATGIPDIITNGFSLDRDRERPVLIKLFPVAKRIEIKHKFDNGYGGCSVLKVKVNRQRKPRLVKLGPKREIELEYEGFTKFEEQWPDELMAPVQNVIMSADMAWGGLVYSFAGSDTFEITSLYKAILQPSANIGTIISRLKGRLLDELDKVWQEHGAAGIKIKESYERILPVNLTLNIFEPAAESPKSTFVFADDPQASAKYPIGTYVCLKDFRLVETEEKGDKKVLTLDGDVPYRVKLHVWNHQPGRFTDIQLGEKIDEICGVIIQTRPQFLQEKVEEVLDYRICSKAQQLSVWIKSLETPSCI